MSGLAVELVTTWIVRIMKLRKRERTYDVSADVDHGACRAGMV